MKFVIDEKFIQSIPFYNSLVSLPHPKFMNMLQWDKKQVKLLTDAGLDKTQARIVINNFVNNNFLDFNKGIPKSNVIKNTKVESEDK